MVNVLDGASGAAELGPTEAFKALVPVLVVVEQLLDRATPEHTPAGRPKYRTGQGAAKAA